MYITKSLWASRLDFRLRSLEPSAAEAICPTPVYIYKYVHYFHWVLKVHCRHCLTCSTWPHRFVYLVHHVQLSTKRYNALHCTWGLLPTAPKYTRVYDNLSGSICKAGFKESWGRCNHQRLTQAVTSICYSIAGGKLCKTTCYWFLQNLGRLLYKVYIWTIFS